MIQTEIKQLFFCCSDSDTIDSNTTDDDTIKGKISTVGKTTKETSSQKRTPARKAKKVRSLITT